MPDYYPLISRGVAALTPNTVESRRAFYERARAAQLDQLRKRPFIKKDFDRERLMLEDAISRVETEAANERTRAEMDTSSPARSVAGSVDSVPSRRGSFWILGFWLTILGFWTITILACGEAAFRTSMTEGITGFAACALCYWGAAAFAGSVSSRRKNYYRLVDLAGIGALACLLVAAGVVLMVWSGFRLDFFGVRINGVAWALGGAFLALLVVRPDDWIAGDISKTGRRPDETRKDGTAFELSPPQSPGPSPRLPSLLGVVKALPRALFGRTILVLIYSFVSLIVTITIMIKGSFVVGIGVLIACAFGFFGTATFVGSFLARKEKAYRATDLIGIGSIASVLVAASFGLAYWTNFRVVFEGYVIDGFYWVLIGVLTGCVITRKKDAL